MGIQEMSVTVSFVILDASPEVQTQNIRWTFTDLNGNSFNIPTDNMMTNFSTNLTGVFSGDRLNLTLSGLNNAFEGTYTMMATNEAGSDSSEVVLVIEGQ
ncbi:MAG: immunoglobulin domain-containing protein [Alphaproteobacteria bacterium]|nr:immunoglobulin domain-containing protein [Alphaproteobacteria bacterium]